MPTTSKRLLSLLSLLQARRDWPGALLAERLDVSARTVRRDVDRLRELGYPIDATKGPDGGYRLGRGADLPPLLFDDEQAVALAVALQLAAASGAGIEEAAARALATVRQVLPSRLRRRADAVRIEPGTQSAPSPAITSQVLVTVGAAVHDAEILRFDYGDTDAPVAPPRRVEPHGVAARHGRFYLVAWDCDRADWRTFRLDRLRPRTPTGPRFAPREIPGGSIAAFLTGRFRGTDGSTSDWPCRGEVEVALPAAELVPYVHDGTVEQVASDRCRVTIGAWSWAGLAARIGQWDAAIEMAGPEELRQAFATLSRRFACAARIEIGETCAR